MKVPETVEQDDEDKENKRIKREENSTESSDRSAAEPSSSNKTNLSEYIDYQTIHSFYPWPSDIKACFICKGKEKGTLSSCQKKLGTANCPILFHAACIQQYNAGGYSYSYLLNKQKSRSCPLHHCSYCFHLRRKTCATYFTQGQNQVTCDQCMQSFHEICIPGCSPIIEKNLIDGDDRTLTRTITCPAHVFYDGKHKRLYPKLNDPKTAKKMHFKVCCECETGDENDDYLFCSNCIRSYHSRCHRFETYIENGVRKNARDLCESCLLGEYIRLDAPGIASFGSRFWPCTVVTTDRYPLHNGSRGDKYRKFLGKPGFVSIRWEGCENMYAVLPISQVISTFRGSYEHYGIKFTDPDFRNAWYRCVTRKDHSWKPIMPEEAYVHIQTSTYTKGVQPVYKTVPKKDIGCDCKIDDPQRCDETCNNRIEGYECPPNCGQIPGKKESFCNNRNISRQLVIDGLEKKLLGRKGYGLFTRQAIKADTFIAEYAGELINDTEKNKRIQQTQQDSNDDEHHYMMDLEENLTIDCKRMGNIARFMNHSCEPNCRTAIVKVIIPSESTTGPKIKPHEYRVEHRVGIFALRDIKKDEELCFNYRMDCHTGSRVPDCYCGTASCTGIMGRWTKPPKGAKRPYPDSNVTQD